VVKPLRLPEGRSSRRPRASSGIAAARVPEVLALFWVVKILTTAGGEAGSDLLAHYGNVHGGGTVLVIFVAGLLVQLGAHRYPPFAYWLFADYISKPRASSGAGFGDGPTFAVLTLAVAALVLYLTAAQATPERALSFSHSRHCGHQRGTGLLDPVVAVAARI